MENHSRTINNNIEEKRVSLEVAKMLKEHGFDVWQIPAHRFIENEVLYYRPTQQVSIDWLRINFGIQIFLDYIFYDGFHYGCKITEPNGDFHEIWLEGKDNDIDGCDTPEEAKEEAIKYALQNLIR